MVTVSRARAEGRRLAHVHRAGQARDGRATCCSGMIVQSGNDAAHRARRGGRRHRGRVRRSCMNEQAQKHGPREHRISPIATRPARAGPPTPRRATSRCSPPRSSAISRSATRSTRRRNSRYNNITQANRNRLLWTDPTVDGMKTGLHREPRATAWSRARSAASGAWSRWCWARNPTRCARRRARSSSTSASRPTTRGGSTSEERRRCARPRSSRAPATTVPLGFAARRVAHAAARPLHRPRRRRSRRRSPSSRRLPRARKRG